MTFNPGDGVKRTIDDKEGYIVEENRIRHVTSEAIVTEFHYLVDFWQGEPKWYHEEALRHVQHVARKVVIHKDEEITDFLDSVLVDSGLRVDTLLKYRRFDELRSYVEGEGV